MMRRPTQTAPAIPKQPTHEAEAVAEAVRVLQRQSKAGLEAALSPPLCVAHQPMPTAIDAEIVAIAYAAKRASFSTVGIIMFADVAANAADYKSFQLVRINAESGGSNNVSSALTTASAGFTAYRVRWLQGLSVTLAEGELLAVSIQVGGLGVALPAFAVIGA